MKKQIIQGREISDQAPSFIIAEAGVNHNGSMNLAFKLIDEAKKAGADCIKFQTFNTEMCESKYALKPEYFKGRDGEFNKKDFSKSLEFNKIQFKDLKQYCDEKGIMFLSMAADYPSFEILLDIGCPAIKIGSSDTLNFPLFKLMGESKLPIIYSTGISTLENVRMGVDYLYNSGVEDLSILQCTSQYPAPFKDINLNVMNEYKKEFDVPVGLSDHSQGLHVPYASIGMGAKIIEKHFTLSRNLPGVDHIASIEPHELKEMVLKIREIEDALGDGLKEIKESEKEHLKTMRKSLFSLSSIKKGDIFSLKNIGSKRPGGGILPIEIDSILGKVAKVDIDEDEYITKEMF
ncbi:N-acetylneuraminate synthase family protein [Arcobacter sp. F2176]|uniref:N-acetylneuraminate synthase family protein n=1 Tax=Arcobacter sp. F2176 TaxID=2044511 RepID=UPI00100ADE36|nr:N-acetylneuraminate synthase family protein [Arcobacter sp. F2176]RXJ82214.1 N-acetylneuraminate synthase [Arcobacter sp. F2176]